MSLIPSSSSGFKNPNMPKGFQVAASNDLDAKKFIIHQAASISSNVGGKITTVLSCNPSSAADWTSISAWYDEFRVLGMRLTLISNQQFSVTAVNNVLYTCFDNDDVTVLSTGNSAAQYGHKYVSPAIWAHVNGQSPTMLFKRPITKNSPIPWVDVAIPSNSLGGIKFYSDGLTASTNYLGYYLEYLVEARGRR
jgi:hypothetical protein